MTISQAAYHEAAHCLVAVLLGRPFQGVSLDDAGTGEVLHLTPRGPEDVPMLLAGGAAELLVGCRAVDRGDGFDRLDLAKYMPADAIEDFIPVVAGFLAGPAIFKALTTLAQALEDERGFSGSEVMEIVHDALGADLPAAHERAQRLARWVAARMLEVSTS